VQDKYDKILQVNSLIDRDVQDLLTRGTYLAEQTLLDAENNHRTAYGLTFMNEVR
jgi:hypothetical protein